MGVVTGGSGSPVTFFAPVGEEKNLVERMRCADRLAGTTIGFARDSARAVYELADKDLSTATSGNVAGAP